jgi:hypothetical protein
MVGVNRDYTHRAVFVAPFERLDFTRPPPVNLLQNLLRPAHRIRDRTHRGRELASPASYCASFRAAKIAAAISSYALTFLPFGEELRPTQKVCNIAQIPISGCWYALRTLAEVHHVGTRR